MAVTGAMYKALSFDGESSRTYGVYITGQAVFNAPHREVEMITIPGRNGTFALDKGRFENIEVSYPAGIFADSEEDFAEAISNFRNFLCSRNGYCRLTDEYNPDEYRLAVYKSGLEVTPAQLKAGQFNIVFDCKPQRFLTSGEDPVTIGEWVDYETETGEVVSFEASDITKIKDIKTAINPIQNGTPWQSSLEKTPYLFRKSPNMGHGYNNEIPKIIGGTVAWNQQCNYTSTATCNANGTLDADFVTNLSLVESQKILVIHRQKDTITSITRNTLVLRQGGVDKKYESATANYHLSAGTYYWIFSAPATGTGYSIRKWVREPNASVSYDNPMLINLTALFGSATIADYIYSLEQATSGSGIQKLREWGFLTKDYYAYEDGSLESVCVSEHNTIGFNQWDEEWEAGIFSTSTGASSSSTNQIRSKNIVPVLPNTTYYFNSNNTIVWVALFDKSGTMLDVHDMANRVDSSGLCFATRDRTFTTPSNAYGLKFYTVSTYGATYNNDICINISKIEGTPKNGDYVAYDGRTYPLDSSKELRGLFKLDANNNLVADGDVYSPSGIGRMYDIVDLGTLNWTYSENRFSAPLVGAKSVANNAVVGNIICAKYSTTYVYAQANREDKTIGISDGSRLYAYDTAYNDASAFTTAMDGVYLVYELATATTESATGFTSPQLVSPDGTEEYVDYPSTKTSPTRDVAIPVGHETTYADIYPISGHSTVKVYVSPTQLQADATEYSVSLGATYYGGELDVTAGDVKEIQTWANLTGLNWTAQSGGIWKSTGITSLVKKPSSASVKVNGIAEAYVVVSASELSNDTSLLALAVDQNGNILVRNGSTTNTPIGKFIYELATPLMHYITSTELNPLIGQNYMWANSGDITVEYGQDPSILANPTLFDSAPLLAVKGYGTVFFNGYEVELLDVPMGRTVLYAAKSVTGIPIGAGRNAAYGFFFRTSKFNMGDIISCGTFTYSAHLVIQKSSVINSVTFEQASGFVADVGAITKINDNLWQCEVDVTYQYNIGDITSGSSDSGSVAIYFVVSYGQSNTSTETLAFAYSTNKQSNFLQFMQVSTSVSSSGNSMSTVTWVYNDIIVDSTKSALGDPSYVDCDLGEAYKVVSGEVISINKAVNFGSDLPKLAVGANTVTKDGTIDQLDIKPNWWKV